MPFRIFTALLAAGVVLIASAALADQGPYLGLGFHSASFGGDLEQGKIVVIRPGPGAAVYLGYKLSPLFSIEARAGVTNQREKISTSKVTMEWQEGGVFLNLTRHEKIRPYVGGGIGKYDIETTGLDFSGTGFFASIGVENVVGEHTSGKLYIQGTKWTDDDFDLDIKAFHVGFSFNYSF